MDYYSPSVTTMSTVMEQLVGAYMYMYLVIISPSRFITLTERQNTNLMFKKHSFYTSQFDRTRYRQYLYSVLLSDLNTPEVVCPLKYFVQPWILFLAIFRLARWTTFYIPFYIQNQNMNTDYNEMWMNQCECFYYNFCYTGCLKKDTLFNR